jgi:hypothetical protein
VAGSELLRDATNVFILKIDGTSSRTVVQYNITKLDTKHVFKI